MFLKNMFHQKMLLLLVDDKVVRSVATYIPNINQRTNLNKPSSNLKLFKK